MVILAVFLPLLVRATPLSYSSLLDNAREPGLDLRREARIGRIARAVGGEEEDERHQPISLMSVRHASAATDGMTALPRARSAACRSERLERVRRGRF